ncbi:MAG TPA: phosphatase PAP2 family protein [Myxococcales bacterium]|nr:phosphatase PAP2 family protein [Myxococcales bacterium]
MARPLHEESPVTASTGLAVFPTAATTPVDRLLLAFLAAAAALAAVFMPSPGRVLLEVAALAAVILTAGRVRGKSVWLGFVHAFLPLLVLSALVNLIGPVIEHVNPYRADAALAAIDAEWFGWLLVRWRNALGRPDWLTDAASVAYVIYYVLPLAVAVPLLRAGRTEEFERFAFSLTAVLLASYAGYFFLPAAGPRVPEDLAQLELGGGWISALVRAFLRAAEENQLDAFPSGHTAVSLALLAAAWPSFPRLRPLLVLAVAAIVFSTVYLSLHYLIDVVAGATLALVVQRGAAAAARALRGSTYRTMAQASPDRTLSP